MYESVFVFVFKRWLVKRGREEYNIRNITDVIRTGRLLAVTKIEHKFIVKTVYGINEQIIYFLLSFFPLLPSKASLCASGSLATLLFISSPFTHLSLSTIHYPST